MHVGIGYSDIPDSTAAGRGAAKAALLEAKRETPCDLVLLFATARHNQRQLREAVASVVGASAKIYGGGAVGIITNDTFGYAGDQVGVACLWLEGVRCDVLTEGGLDENEEETGVRLGERLAAQGATEDSSVMLFYDAVNRSGGDVRLMMATWLLEGLKKGLGFLPDLTGAGLQGDHVCTETSQYTGDTIQSRQAMALFFSDDIRIDSVIMHGCHPASEYYTVTEAEGSMILKINGRPAIEFMDGLLGPAITPEEYPFFLLFGINHGDPWGEYDENNYASRLCLGIDKARGGIIMFEPDMVPGTRFQLMYRAMDLDYIRPKVEAAFDQLQGREPVFAMYIDCAGRCAGYGGLDLEDAVVLQETVGHRVPLLGLYTGVEIAPIGGRPRGLDWTGVFCLFSKAKGGEGAASRPQRAAAWESRAHEDPGDIPVEAALRIAGQNAAKILALDTQSIAIRHELEQKRRGFSLLSELSVSLRHGASHESVFVPVAQRINAALNMQKTAVLIPDNRGLFMPTVLQGYTVEEKAGLAGRHIAIPGELLDAEYAALVTAEDDGARYADLRSTLRIEYFISSPVIIKDQVAALLITGRMAESPPFLSRLGRSDVETVQAIGALLGSVLVHQRLEAAEERAHIMLDAMPLSCIFWDEKGDQIDSNEEALRMFGMPDKESLLRRVYALAPERQPDGSPSRETLRQNVLNAFVTGSARFEWIFMTFAGEILPSEVTLVRVPRGENYAVVGYIRDLREQKAALEEMRQARDMAERNVRAKNEFLAAVSHEVRTPLNAILAMERTLAESEAEVAKFPRVEQGIRSARLLGSTIESILHFSSVEAGQVTLAKEPFSVTALLRSMEALLAPEAAAKGLALRVEAAEDIPGLVMGDSTRLEQALRGIASNAVKFTEKGEVVIRASREEADAPGCARLHFSVRDTGIGISREDIRRIFEPLTALDTSYTRKQAGLGMGLAISRSLARLMEGEITCESTPGQGSVFTLSVTLGLPEEEAREASRREKDKPTDEGLSGLRVLVAEDNPINQMIIEELLTAVGIEAVVAENGLLALEALEAAPFDLVLMDIQMPEMDGLTAAAQIRRNPRHQDLPILAMTANSAPEHRAESMESGMNDHLTKPVDVQELYAALRRWGKRDGGPPRGL